MFHSSDRVLVAIMNNRRDFEIARDEGWYRIPQKSAPSSTTEAAALAFYFTKAFGDEEKWSIRWYTAVRGHELVRRRDLLPDEPDHPRTDEAHYKLQLGPLMQTVAVAMGDRAAPPSALRDPDLETVRRAVQELGGKQPIHLSNAAPPVDVS